MNVLLWHYVTRRKPTLPGKATSLPSEIPLLPTSRCKTRAAKHTHPLHHLLGQNEAQQSRVPGKERGFRESQQEQMAGEVPAPASVMVKIDRSEAVHLARASPLPAQAKAKPC